MLGFHPIQTSLVQLVPARHIYQRLLQTVDFSFVRPLMAPFYSAMSRPSLDPVVFIKLLLVAHLENITSDRKLLELAQLHLGIRAFLGYELQECLPWHSTLSRTRQRIPVSVFERCFTHIVGLCVQQGLVSGHTQLVDSAYIKANASMSRLKPKLPSAPDEATKPLSLRQDDAPHITASPERLQHIRRYHAVIQQTNPKKAGQLVSNLTHYSPADPDARIAFKTGKPRLLAYTASVSVDAARHVITHIQADLADWRDSRYLLGVVDTTHQRLQTWHLAVQTVVADAGYSSGENYQGLEQRGLTGFIPPHGKYLAERPGFRYDAASDAYSCSQGKLLTFDKGVVDAQGNAKKRYMANPADCRACPLGPQCKGKQAREKRLHHTLYKAQYERMLARLATGAGKRMMRLRAATVEPLLGSLINYYGLRHISKKRREGAAKVMYIAAMAYNLKKYLHYHVSRPAGIVMMLALPEQLYLVFLPFATATRLM